MIHINSSEKNPSAILQARKTETIPSMERGAVLRCAVSGGF